MDYQERVFIYMKKGLLNPEYKNGVQYYNKDDLLKLQKIKALRNMNYSLNAIKKIVRNN
ncbi:MAG: MerR family transcriptional regulator [Faecalibacillus faecis]